MKFFGGKKEGQTKAYQVLPSTNNGSDIGQIPSQSKYKTFKVTLFSILLFLLLLSVLALLPISTAPTSPTHLAQLSSSCGSTRSEALSRNCTFDPMSFSWLPLACYDGPLTEDFLSLRPWRWTIDRAGYQSVPLDEVLRGDHAQLYVSWEYHLLHCTYMWRKLHRAMLSDGWVDGYIGNYNHTSHCEMMLMKGGDKEEINTIIRTKFVDCNPI